jgi:hypothetical protein
LGLSLTLESLFIPNLCVIAKWAKLGTISSNSIRVQSESLFSQGLI